MTCHVPFPADYNDLPLGKMAKNIQEAVATTYHSSNRDLDQVICEVRDEDLKDSDDYWLNENKKNS